MQTKKTPQFGRRNRHNNAIEIEAACQTPPVYHQPQSPSWHYPLDLRVEAAPKTRVIPTESHQPKPVIITIKKSRALRHE